MKTLLNYTEFLIEKWNQQYPDIILEGGAAGHMMHPFDDETLTFGEIKHIIDGALEGRLDFEAAPTEKTDGQNVFVTVKNGQAMFARNKGQMKQPIDLNGITQMFQDHPSTGVRDTFTFAAQDLASALQSLSTKDQQEFNDGTSFMNMELIYSGNSNVIAYGKDVIQFHGMVHTDGEGNQTGSDSKLAGKITNALKSVNSHVQKTFEIIPPQELQIGKSIDFEEKKTYFLKKTIKKLALTNVKVEESHITNKTPIGPFTLITARAFSHTQNIINICNPMLEPGGTYLLLKGKEVKINEEIQSINKKEHKCEIIKVKNKYFITC